MTMLDSLSGRDALARGMAGFARLLPDRGGPSWPTLPRDALAYAVDAAQRGILFWDTMRRAGNAFVEHERAGCPPVLSFGWQMVVDGRTLARPVNYALVRIDTPAGAPPGDPQLRPFVIIDPRAGHGSGIGGFKDDSQVGVALRRGHPVYFVIFFRDPEPGQTILDITAAEEIFLRRIAELHPDAPKPVVVGNCQGGWAVMMLGASAPELTGPLVLNGAPLSYWAGESGKNPMRYMGGLAGGSWPAALLADLGHGRFDGAGLVMNFEALSPGNTWFRKYYNLFESIDTETDRFLEFDRWWGGYFLMNRDEILWIVENLFIGNRFARGEIAAGGGASFDMRAVKSPVVVFASAGDNITPPGQALRWIIDVYPHEGEIRARGQTIIYLVHEDIGHLGIFVSGKVALKEHTEINSTLEMIEALSPGLYELRITGTEGTGANTGFQVELVERSIAHVRSISGEASNEAYPAVARVSAINQGFYDMAVSPIVRRLATEQTAELRRQLHPMRVRRYAISDHNPLTWGLAPVAEAVRERRAPTTEDNPFRILERSMADTVELGFDMFRDMRDAATGLLFHATYGALAAWGMATGTGETALVERPSPAFDGGPEVQAALSRIDQGGYAEAVVRMMVLLAQARGSVRRANLARSNALMTGEAPFAGMTADARAALIREQTWIASLRTEAAIAALPGLLPAGPERARALAAVAAVVGPEADIGDAAGAMYARIKAALA